jgi:hypothetical protein
MKHRFLPLQPFRRGLQGPPSGFPSIALNLSKRRMSIGSFSPLVKKNLGKERTTFQELKDVFPWAKK